MPHSPVYTSSPQGNLETKKPALKAGFSDYQERKLRLFLSILFLQVGANQNHNRNSDRFES
jgi:hypothetical protein